MPIIAGYMVPHPPIAVKEIGRGEEKRIRATLDAFERVSADIAALRPDTVILTSPHQVMYRDYFHISPGEAAEGSFARFGAPQVRLSVRYDTALRQRLEQLCLKIRFPAGTRGERDAQLDHGTMVPLYFIHSRYRGFRLLRIGLSGLPLREHVRFGELIRQAVDECGCRAVFVASGDLAHCQKPDGPYGYRPEGPAYDARLMDVMGRADFGALLDFEEAFLEESMECGHRSFTIMGGAFGKDALKAEVLSHEATFGVGYGFVIYHPAGRENNG